MGFTANQRHRIFCRRADVLGFLFRHVALFDIHGTPAADRPQETRDMMAQASTKTTGAAESNEAGTVAVQLVSVNKWYGEFHVLRDINLAVERGERIVICGPSGSGKSTLIRCINRLEEHQSGQIIVDGIELTNDLKRIDEVRREVGMVFQHFNLFPHLTVLENCTLAPIWVRRMPKAEAEKAAMKYLERVRIPEQANKYPGQLSGGQQQRVAIARVLAGDPRLILADEPTGNLDSLMTREIMDLLERINEQGTTIVMVTHSPECAARAQRQIHLLDGKVVDLDAAPTLSREPLLQSVS
jgi:general L-amino acid transport system ATP-binding protein